MALARESPPYRLSPVAFDRSHYGTGDLSAAPRRTLFGDEPILELRKGALSACYRRYGVHGRGGSGGGVTTAMSAEKVQLDIVG